MIILSDKGLKQAALFPEVCFDCLKFKRDADLLTLVFTLEGEEVAYTTFQIPPEDVTLAMNGIGGYILVHKEVN